jgi:hypothetical protein
VKVTMRDTRASPLDVGANTELNAPRQESQVTEG